jgi:hypothetical protein
MTLKTSPSLLSRFKDQLKRKKLQTMLSGSGVRPSTSQGLSLSLLLGQHRRRLWSRGGAPSRFLASR